MATEGTPFRDRYASEARAAAARAHAPPVEEPPTPQPRRVHREARVRLVRGGWRAPRVAVRARRGRRGWAVAGLLRGLDLLEGVVLISLACE